jgi:hypothetical protein
VLRHGVQIFKFYGLNQLLISKHTLKYPIYLIKKEAVVWCPLPVLSAIWSAHQPLCAHQPFVQRVNSKGSSTVLFQSPSAVSCKTHQPFGGPVAARQPLAKPVSHLKVEIPSAAKPVGRVV